MFGHWPQRIFCAPVSKVKSNDPAKCEKYIENVLVQYETNGILLSFCTLQQYCESQQQGVDVYNEIVYNHKKIAEKMHKIRSEVDSNICKFYNSTTPQSP